MKRILELRDEDFFQWLKVQLEKRSVLHKMRLDKKLIKEELYLMLFQELGITVDDIERFFIPFNQAGYLSPRQKFEIILFVMEKDYGKCFLFLEGAESTPVITGEDIEAVYLQWLEEDRLFLSDEEKKEFFVQSLMDRLGLDVLEVLKRAAPDGFLIGELCPAFYAQESAEERIAVCSNGSIIRLPFLAIKSKEELIRIIKYKLILENKGELTMMEPILDFVQDDGTCITAVRPPAGRDWGIRILYGAAGKEEAGWRN
ncbi:MAG: hypothetical protein J6C07_07125 [Lachnospiraceae bacterium]|nr:hypothetical protein [Lachnospiraceae bacterium]